MILFVDKIMPRGLGAIINTKRKAEYTLAANKLTIEGILDKAPSHLKYPTGLFHNGRYVVVFNFKRDIDTIQISFINHEIDLDENFDVFADTFSPKLVGEYHRLTEIIKQKTQEQLDSIELSDNDLDFEIAYQNYIDYQNHRQ